MENQILELQYALDTFYFLVMGALVMWMAAGFTMLESGLVRAKNTTEILTKNVALYAVSCVMYLLMGYTIMYGGSDGGILPDSWFGNSIANATAEEVLAGAAADASDYTYYSGASDFFFQVVFVATAMSIVSGAVAERMKLWSFLAFAVVMTGVIYPLQGMWKWGGGFLDAAGFLDFAGSGVVHMTGAAAALAAVILLGARKGKYRADGSVNAIPGANMPMAALGMFILWVGWFGFNAGSALAADGNAGMAMLVTHLSAAAGCLTWSFIEWIRYGKPSALGAVTGMVAGLGTITPASGYVGPAGAMVIGLSAGIVCFYCTLWLKQVFKIDDSLDVFPVHGVGGILGTFMAGIFASSELGVFSGQGLAEGMTILSQLKVQLIGIGATFAYTAVVSLILFYVIDKLIGLRVTADEEAQGLDITCHNEVGYDL